MDNAGFKSFLRAFCRDWFTGMSGALSVPLMIWATFVDEWWAQIGLALTAVACGVWASYSVWRVQREKVRALEETVRPRFEILNPRVLITEVGDGQEEWEIIARVKNGSAAKTIGDVAVFGLLKNPNGQAYGPEKRLTVRSAQSTVVYPLNPGDTGEHTIAAATHGPSDGGIPRFWDGVRGDLDTDYVAEIIVRGKDVREQRRSFVVTALKGKLVWREADT
jgi:hypothetical protein